MEYILIIFLVLCIVFLSILLKRKIASSQQMQSQLKTTKAQLEQTAQLIHSKNTLNAQIWELTNTIHLYAAMSEEESSAESIKEKQTEIMRLSESILELI